MAKHSEKEPVGRRTPAEAVTDEEIREDRLRGTDLRPGVSRWIRLTLTAHGALEARLRAAGLHTSRRKTGAIG